MKADRVRRFALSLPEALEAPHFDYASFRVGGKIFATMPPDNAHLHVFVGEEQRETALALHPECIEKLFWGKTACGLRIALDTAKPAVVEALLRQAWAQRAPKRLLKNGE
jgi:hypothetical protein